MPKFIFYLGLFLLSLQLHAEKSKLVWPLEQLYQAPRYEQVENSEFPFDVPSGIRGVFFDSVKHDGQTSKVFAWIALPEKSEGKAPAMVLVHGGGGTAFLHWAKYWQDRGFAAIAMDTYGNIPKTPFEGEGCSERHTNSPGAQYEPFNDEIPIPERWQYHAVSAVIAAHSLIRSLPEVDADKVGITGISWGGFLTCMVAGLDRRFAMAAPVYGCGYLAEASWLIASPFTAFGKERTQKWVDLWGPENYLSSAKMPILFVNDPNDFSFWQSAWTKSSQLPAGSVYRSDRLKLGHNHFRGMTDEVVNFAEMTLKKKGSIPRELNSKIEVDTLTVSWDHLRDSQQATLVYTTDSGDGPDRQWQEIPCRLDINNRTASATLPKTARSFFINIQKNNGTIFSSTYHDRPKK